MNIARKHIRIALSADDTVTFAALKSQVEAQIGITMSDSAFAASIIRQVLKEKTSKA